MGERKYHLYGLPAIVTNPVNRVIAKTEYNFQHFRVRCRTDIPLAGKHG